MRIERRPHATRPAIVAAALTFLSVVWKLVGAWSNVDFLNQNSGLFIKVAHAVFFTSVGTNALIILSVAILLVLLLFQPKKITNTAQKTNGPVKRKLKIDYMQSRVIDVSLDEETGEIQGPQEYLDSVKSVVAEFRRLPDDAEIGFIDVRASIQLWPQNRNRILVNDAQWSGRCRGSEYCTFDIGDSAPLIIALFGNNLGITYEGRYVNNTFISDPNELNEDSYDIDIELIGTKENKVLVHQIFELVLTLRPELTLGIRNLHAEVNLAAPIVVPAKAVNVVDAQVDPPPRASTEDKSR